MDRNHEILVTSDDSRSKKDERQRMTAFADWLSANDRVWHEPDLDAYRDFLATDRGLKPLSIRAHIATIRARYRTLLDDPEIGVALHAAVAMLHRDAGTTEYAVTQLKESIQAAVSYDAGKLEAERDLQGIVRLVGHDVLQLIEKPDYQTLQGLRDMILIGLMFCAGLNESELSALESSDLDHDADGNLTIRITSRTDDVGRTATVYDGLIFEVPWIERYMKVLRRQTRATKGLLFRGYFRGGNVPSPRPLTLRGIQNMLRDYPIVLNGRKQAVTGLDLRRGHARQLYFRGIDAETIAKNLGHRQLGTTYEYIGPPDVDGSGSPLSQLDTRVVEERYRWWLNHDYA